MDDDEGGIAAYQRPRPHQFADLTVGSEVEFRGLEVENLDLARAVQHLEERWWQDPQQQQQQGLTPGLHQPAGSSHAGQRGGAAAPKAEVLAALQALGSQQRHKGGPAQEQRWEQGGSDDEQGWGGRSEGAGSHVYARMPSDRQVQRPPELQAHEWAHLGPQLALRGRQLVPERDSGVQHLPPPPLAPAAAAAAASPRVPPSAPHLAGPAEGAHPHADTLASLCVQGQAVRLQPAPALPGGQQQQQAEEYDEGEVVFAQDGVEEEVLAVQWDTWDAPLLQWGQRTGQQPPSGVTPPLGFLLSPPVQHAALGQPPDTAAPAPPAEQQQQQQQGGTGEEGEQGKGSEEPWAGLLHTSQAGGGVVGEDVRDARALRQGLPPLRPHLSVCEQLVTLVMERWWHSHVEELVPMVKSRLAARAAAREREQQHQQQGGGEGEDGAEDGRAPSPPHSPSHAHTPVPPSPPPPPQPEEHEGDQSDYHDDAAAPPPQPQEWSQPLAPAAPLAPRAHLDWKSMMATQPVHTPLGQGVLTPQGYQPAGPMTLQLAPGPPGPSAKGATPAGPWGTTTTTTTTSTTATGGAPVSTTRRPRGTWTGPSHSTHLQPLPAEASSSGLQGPGAPLIPTGAPTASTAAGVSIWAGASRHVSHTYQASRAVSLPARLHHHQPPWGTQGQPPPPPPRILPPMDASHRPPLQLPPRGAPLLPPPQAAGQGDRRVRSGHTHTLAHTSSAPADPPPGPQGPSLSWQGTGQGGGLNTGAGTGGHRGSPRLLSTSAPAAVASTAFGGGGAAHASLDSQVPSAHVPPSQAHHLLGALVWGAGNVAHRGTGGQAGQGGQGGGGGRGSAPILPPLRQPVAVASKQHGGRGRQQQQQQQQQQRTAAMMALSEALQLGAAAGTPASGTGGASLSARGAQQGPRF